MKFDRATDESIQALLRAFYEKLRSDARLAPVFADALGNDWAAHIATMCDFWGSAMRVSRRYDGDMLAVHRRLEALRPALFERWLELFDETVTDHCAPDFGAALRDRARKTARNLQLALFHQPHRPAAAGAQALSGR